MNGGGVESAAVETRRPASVKPCANVSTVRASRSRPEPRNSIRSSGAGRATRSRPPSRRTRRNSPAFIRAVMESTTEKSDRHTARSDRRWRRSTRIRGSAARRHRRPEPRCRCHAQRSRSGGRGRRGRNRRRSRHRERYRPAMRPDLRDGIEQRPGYAAIVQSAPSCNGGRCVAGLARPAVLRLEQVDVSAARDIERMSARTEHAPIRALEWQSGSRGRSTGACVECSG